MRKIEKKNIPVEIVTEILCNKCGKSFNVVDFENTNLIDSFKIVFGYGSRFDGEQWSFDLCNNCIIEMVSTFKIPPKEEYIGLL
jgi:hypothetical protein